MILSHVPQLLFPSSWILDFETVIIYFSAGFSFFFFLFVSNTSCNIVFNFLLLHSHYVCLRKKEGWTNRRDGGGGIGVCIVLLGIYIIFKQVMDPSSFYAVIWIRILQEKHELTHFKTFTIYLNCLSPCLTFAESKGSWKYTLLPILLPWLPLASTIGLGGHHGNFSRDALSWR